MLVGHSYYNYSVHVGLSSYAQFREMLEKLLLDKHLGYSYGSDFVGEILEYELFESAWCGYVSTSIAFAYIKYCMSRL
jgi:hypothetical protein